jgi:citrate synthase
MEEKELFKITESHLDTGLRGFPIGYCITSYVDPDKGVFYRNYPISEIAHRETEEVMYLLIKGTLPNHHQLNDFKKDLCNRSKVSKELKEAILALPRKGHPMKMYAMAILLLGVYESKNDINEDFMNLQAKLPEITAIVMNHRAGYKDTPVSTPEIGYVPNFCHMLHAPSVKDKKLFATLINLFINLHMDHGGGNLSLFVAKSVASGHEDLYGSFAASLLALSGPRHGKANQDGLEFVKKIHHQLGDNASAIDVKKAVETMLSKGELIYGFGHAALRCEDPRATILFEFAEKTFPNHPLVRLAKLLHTEVPKILKENPKIKNPYSNIDSISGVVLSAIGFDFPDYFTVLFGLSRSTGAGRQIAYETLEARDGKGVPIYRPKYIYKEA